VSSTGAFTLESMRSWQLAAAVPVTKARAHSGSYSFRFWGGSLAAAAKPAPNAAASGRSRGGSSRGIAATRPSQSPTSLVSHSFSGNAWAT